MNSKSKKPGKAPGSNNTLRIIGGAWRGRQLPFATADGLRPTGDRIRETLFNWLTGQLEGCLCLDLFAGSGALGFEALSRGAARVTMIESNRNAAQQLRANADLLRTPNAQILQQDAFLFLATPPPSGYDLVFLDPPFQKNLWAKAVAELAANQWLNPGALIYIETPRDTNVTPPCGWVKIKNKAAGQVDFSLWQCQAEESDHANPTQ